MNRRSYVFALILLLLGVVSLVSGLEDVLRTVVSDGRGLLLWLILLISSGLLTFVPLRDGGAIAGTAVISFAILLTYGGEVASWLAAIQMLVLTRILRFDAWRTIFNVSQIATSLRISGIIYSALGGLSISNSPATFPINLPILLAVIACHMVHFTTNTWLVTVWNSLRLKISALGAWKGNYLWMLPQSFATPIVAIGLAYSFERLPLIVGLLFFLWLIYYARSSRINFELQESQRGTVAALAKAVDSGLRFLEGESERVAGLAVELAKRVGLSGWRLQTLEYSALLHDIGYLAISRKVLTKREPLSPQEWREVRRHSEIGASIVQGVSALRRVGEIIRLHHERPDGRGYPFGLKGNRIPKEARILRVADAFVAMTTPRPYRPALSVDEAVAKIREGVGVSFDRDVVEGLLDIWKEGLLENFVLDQADKAA